MTDEAKPDDTGDLFADDELSDEALDRVARPTGANRFGIFCVGGSNLTAAGCGPSACHKG